MPTNLISELYDDFAEDGYSKLAADPAYYPLSRVFPDILRKYSLENETTVLDLGCGTGLLKEFSSFKKYIGVDLSAGMLKEAARRGYQEIYEADVEDYLRIVDSEVADVLVCFSVSYFWPTELLKYVLERIPQLARKAWIITFDGISPALAEYYQKEFKIKLYNHLGTAVPNEIERFEVEGWLSPIAEDRIEMEVVVGGKI